MILLLHHKAPFIFQGKQFWGLWKSIWDEYGFPRWFEECGAHLDGEVLIYLKQMCSPFFITIQLGVGLSEVFGTQYISKFLCPDGQRAEESPDLRKMRGRTLIWGDFLGKEASDEEMEVRAFSAGCLLDKEGLDEELGHTNLVELTLETLKIRE